MKVPVIETARLRLRRFTPDDLDALTEIVSDPRVMRYLGNGETFDREASKPHLRNFMEKHWQEHSFGRWALDYKSNGELIGHCGFRLLEDEPELVYLLAEQYWNLGLATEAAKACLRYGFETLQLSKVIALTKVENAASQRVLEKVGLTFEKETQFYNIDCLYYSMSREAYSADHDPYRLTYVDLPSETKA